VASQAYLAGLRLLGRREFSERQLRERLRRRGYEPDDIDAAIERLRADRSLDDTRVAYALARQELLTKRHGRLRARRQLEMAGIAPTLADAAIQETLAGADPEALLAAALSRRLRGADRIEDEAQFRRLYRFLIGQGFEPDRILAALRPLRAR
jgi:regulatory protein